jgi:Flp pilus assembly protein TadG
MMKLSFLRQRGVAIIEFALVVPLLLILTFLVTEFGRALYEYNVVVKSLRDAARYLSEQDPTIKATDPAKVLVARNLVVYGFPSPSSKDKPLVLGLSLSNVPDVNIAWRTVGSDPLINTVTIKVTGYKFRPLAVTVFGQQLADSNGEIAFGDISATMRSQL